MDFNEMTTEELQAILKKKYKIRHAVNNKIEEIKRIVSAKETNFYEEGRKIGAEILEYLLENEPCNFLSPDDKYCYKEGIKGSLMSYL